MKVAFPLINEKELAVDFVHSHFVGIFDDVKNRTDLLPIAGIEKNVGITVFFDAMTSQGLKFVVSPHFSFMSLRVFKENNIEPYKAEGVSLQDNIDLFKTAALKPFDIRESYLGGECARECGSCGSTCK
jgi:hypothetical protein